MGLTSYYFQIGGLRISNRDITCKEMGGVDGLSTTSYGIAHTGASTPLIEDESDAYVELFKSQNIFKSYQIGVN